MSVVPTLSLQVAFGHGPLDPTPVWTEIATLVETLDTTMGRQHQLDRVEPSTLKALLDGRQGEMSPWSTLSPYYNLMPTDDALGLADIWSSLSFGTTANQSTQTLWGPTAGVFTGSASGSSQFVAQSYPVSGSKKYTFSVWLRAATVGEPISCELDWYGSSGFISASYSSTVTDSTTGWTQLTFTATSPPGATSVEPYINDPNLTAHSHYFTCVMLSYNPNGVPIGWSPGQTLPLVPGKPVRCVPTWSSTPYPVFYGYTDSWTPQPVDALNTSTQLQASDVLKQLNRKYLVNTTVWPNLVLSLSPAFFYRCDDPVGSTNVGDASGNGLTGTAYSPGGTIPPPTFGKTGLMLYDPDTAVDISDGSSGPGWAIYSPTMAASHTSGNGSAMVWFSTTSTLTGVGYYLLNVAEFVEFADIYGGTSLGLRISGDPLSALGSTVVNDGLAHCAVLTWSYSGSATVLTLYLDGVFVGTGTLSSSTKLPGTIGVGSYPCVVDEIAGFTSVLTSGQVASLFTVGHYFRDVEYTGQRIAKALIVAGYGSYPQNLATGTVLCQAETSAVTQSLCGDYVLVTNDTENGLLFQDTSGVIQFKDRHYPQINSTTTTSQATIGDNTGATYHYDVTGLSIPQDDLDLWPDVKAQRNNGVVQEVLNLTAANLYGEATLQRTGLVASSDTDVLYLAQWLNYLYAFPQIRVASVTLSSITAAGANLPQMLGRALWDAVTIQRQAPGESQLNQLNAVESVGHSFDASAPSWKTTWQLSPFEVSPKANLALILDSSTNGILDTNVVGG